jgi:hypothetical protein
MEALQEQLHVAEQERDAARTAATQADAERAQAIMNLTAATAAAAVAAADQPAAPPPAPIFFALSPALATNATLDYRTGEGMKMYGKAIAPLDVLFSGDAALLRLFLSKVRQRATQSGWTGILQVTQGGVQMSFIENYGQITLESIRLQAAALETSNDRGTQNSSQMYQFLITSVTDELLGRVISQRESYTSATGFEDGPSLLKVIVTISHVDTRAQAGYIRQCLARLSITILTPEYNCNIQKINEHVAVLEEGLHARGETSQDTMMNVNTAYMACKDADFVRHAKDEYGRWEQGATMTLLKGYMASCLVKYKTLKMKGLWEAPSPEQEQIIALTAAVSSLKTKAASKVGNKTKTGSSDKSNKKTDKVPSRTRNAGIFAWKDVPPGAGEATTKVFNEKTYYWCTHHPSPMWALHNPDTYPNLCRLHTKYKEIEAAHKAKGGASEMTANDIKINTALQAIEDSDDESDSDSI